MGFKRVDGQVPNCHRFLVQVQYGVPQIYPEIIWVSTAINPGPLFQVVEP